MSFSLKARFKALISYVDNNKQDEMWDEIQTAYSHKNRIYHNLEHLENLFSELLPIHDLIEDWETISLSVFYHDIVYNVRKKDNEEQSAILAEEKLNEIHFSKSKIVRCSQQIIATKSHDITPDNDANLFTDADLSILGQSWESYQVYFNAIRKEYKIYPDLLYKPARKKVLIHFLEMPGLFKTEYFKSKYEIQARKNIQQELELL